MYAIWRDRKYGGFLFTGTTILRRSTNGGESFEPEQSLSSIYSEYNTIAVNDSIVCVAWESYEEGDHSTKHIYATYSTDRGMTFLPYSKVEHIFYSSKEPDAVIGSTLFLVGKAGGRVFFTKYGQELHVKSK